MRYYNVKMKMDIVRELLRKERPEQDGFAFLDQEIRYPTFAQYMAFLSCIETPHAPGENSQNGKGEICLNLEQPPTR